MPCAQEEGKRGRSVSHAHPRSSGGGGGWLVDCHGEVLSSTSDPRTDDRALLPKVKGTMGVCVCVFQSNANSHLQFTTADVVGRM